MFSQKIIALLIFTFCYLLFILWPGRRALIAILGSSLLIVLGVLTIPAAFWAINWNVMGMFVGMLVVADYFMVSRVPAYFAEVIVNRASSTGWAILFICLLTGFISAFVENIATVLIVAPIAIELARKLKINPVNILIAIAVSSNLQGAATLIGDPPSMLLGSFAHMNFNDFFFYQGKPSIFWAVELGALASLVVLYFLFNKHRERKALPPTEKVKSWFPSLVLVVLILLLALASFLENGATVPAGLLCMLAAAGIMIWGKFSHNIPPWKKTLELDWETTLFLAGVFVLVGGITAAGWIDTLSRVLSGLVGGNVFLGYTFIVVFSVLVSAFVDNVPYLAAMLPVALSMSKHLQIEPSLFLFGLLIGASLGGNITPIGASANIAACGILKKEGYPVTFGQFMKVGVPFTLAAVSAAYLFIWIVWK